MPQYSKELLQRTIRALQPHGDSLLSEESAAEALDNLTALLLYLHELEQKYGREENL